jgi:hypothetical protein
VFDGRFAPYDAAYVAGAAHPYESHRSKRRDDQVYCVAC